MLKTNTAEEINIFLSKNFFLLNLSCCKKLKKLSILLLIDNNKFKIFLINIFFF
jgi:hypothetical protein